MDEKERKRERERDAVFMGRARELTKSQTDAPRFRDFFLLIPALPHISSLTVEHKADLKKKKMPTVVCNWPKYALFFSHFS